MLCSPAAAAAPPACRRTFPARRTPGRVFTCPALAVDGGDAAPVATGDAASAAEAWDYDAPRSVLERNAAFVERVLKGRLLLAPLTRGGNLPFRRLCVDYDSDLPTMSEMAFARQLLKGDRVERARLFKSKNETSFGVQIATNNIAEGVGAARAAADAGAAWVDLNAGCPIYEATKRGLGAALLRKPIKMARLVAGIVEGSPLPVTVKIRIGESERKQTAAVLVPLLARAGAAAIAVHGRTAEQRYKKAADWDAISRLAAATPNVAIIGNGDLLTHYEVQRRRSTSGCAALMAGRGALIKPWLFEEVKQGRELLLDARDRIGVYRRLACYMREHFGDDAMGKRKSWYFFPWHFAFFCRWRPLPASVYEQSSLEHPLIATRADLVDGRLGESEEGLAPVERLLRCEAAAAHGPIADVIWEASSDGEAYERLDALAAAELPGWEAQLREGGSGAASDPDERGGSSSSSGGGAGGRRQATRAAVAEAVIAG